MGKLIVLTSVTLDGVMQAPGHPDEDRRGGFPHGGWAVPYAAMQATGDVIGGAAALLFGRLTYESFYAAWANQPGNPFSAYFDNIPKYVASATLQEPLVWQNSALLHGDLGPAVRDLKQNVRGDLLVFGSGGLVQSLLAVLVVDQLVLLIHPLVLGAGSRLFPDGAAPTSFKLTSTSTTDSGVVVARYAVQRAAPA